MMTAAGCKIPWGVDTPRSHRTSPFCGAKCILPLVARIVFISRLQTPLALDLHPLPSFSGSRAPPACNALHSPLLTHEDRPPSPPHPSPSPPPDSPAELCKNSCLHLLPLLPLSSHPLLSPGAGFRPPPLHGLETPSPQLWGFRELAPLGCAARIAPLPPPSRSQSCGPQSPFRLPGHALLCALEYSVCSPPSPCLPSLTSQVSAELPPTRGCKTQ